MVEGGFDAEAYLEQVRLLLREAKVALGGKPKGYRATNALAFAREADALTDDPANRDTPVEVRLAFGDMAARPSLMTDRLTAKGLLAKSVTGLGVPARRAMLQILWRDYLGLNVRLSRDGHGAYAMKRSPVFYMSPAQFDNLGAAFPNIAPDLRAQLVLRNPRNPEAAAQCLQDQITGLSAIYPDATPRQLAQLALHNPTAPMETAKRLQERVAGLAHDYPDLAQHQLVTHLRDG